jgi:predicted DNA binding protein
MNTNRDLQGKFARRQRRNKVIRIAVLLGIIAFIAFAYHSATVEETTFVRDHSIVTPVVDPHQTEIDKIKERENFKKRIENQAKQVYLSEEISSRKVKIETLNKEINDIEVELEQTRKEELSFR